MTDSALLDLAHAAGIAPQWKDVFGHTHDVTPDTLRAVLKAQGLPAFSAAQIAESLAIATALPATLPPLITAQVGYPVYVPMPPARYHLQLEDGRTFDGYAEPAARGATIPAILEGRPAPAGDRRCRNDHRHRPARLPHARGHHSGRPWLWHRGADL